MMNLWTGKGKDVPINQKWEAFKQELKELIEQEEIHKKEEQLNND